MTLFGKVVEPFRGEASLEEVGHWLQALKRNSPAPLLAHSLLSERGCNVTGWPLAPATVPSPLRWTVSPWNYKTR